LVVPSYSVPGTPHIHSLLEICGSVLTPRCMYIVQNLHKKKSWFGLCLFLYTITHSIQYSDLLGMCLFCVANDLSIHRYTHHDRYILFTRRGYWLSIYGGCVGYSIKHHYTHLTNQTLMLFYIKLFINKEKSIGKMGQKLIQSTSIGTYVSCG